jgi:hypothetical protein
MNKSLLLFILILASISLITAADAAPAKGFGESGGTLDRILNVLIPLACFGMFLMLIYKAFKEPLDNAFKWIREQMSPKEQAPDGSMYRRYRNAYMIPGDIKYN